MNREIAEAMNIAVRTVEVHRARVMEKMQAGSLAELIRRFDASGELIPRLSTHRNVVALDSTDFTDVAAVVITTADSRSGILA
ncbi:LuxR C-terminal-related transcriptional regulator, partial [Salmonella enterica subsp. enterica serovar Montevideo]|nr:LuxR C-terminal-related transcriptional regulator [Salmonella enterica subsp. enterica serovar Montevideo]